MNGKHCSLKFHSFNEYFLKRFLEELNLRTSYHSLLWQQFSWPSHTQDSHGLKFWFMDLWKFTCHKERNCLLSRRDIIRMWFWNHSATNLLQRREKPVGGIPSDCNKKDESCQKAVILTEKWHYKYLDMVQNIADNCIASLGLYSHWIRKLYHFIKRA